MSPSITNCLLSTQSDARLVELTRQGHERAFEALVQRYRRPLLRYCRGLRLPEERAEDALQQALLGAWLALRAGTEVRAVKPWLYRVAHNAAVNVLRVSGDDHVELSETTLVAGVGAPHDELARRMALSEAFAGLASLPQMQRAALLQTAVEGHSHEDVASSLGVSEGALRGLVYRARASLRAAATAVTPGPLIGWLTRASGGSQPIATRLAELGAGGGSVGLAGVLMKSGALVLSTGVLVGGIAGHHGGLHRGKPHAVARHVVRRVPVAGAPTSSLRAAPAPHHAQRRARTHPHAHHRVHEGSGRSRETSTDDRGGTGGEEPRQDALESGGPGRGGPGPNDKGEGGPGNSGAGDSGGPGDGGLGDSGGPGDSGPDNSGGPGDSGNPGTSGSSGGKDLVVGGDLLSQEGQREDHEDAHHDQ